MDTYTQNLKLLKLKQPLLAAKIDAFQNFLQDVDILKTKNNSFTVKKRFLKNDHESSILLHSLYDPQKEASRLVNNYTISDHSNIAVLGFGFGYHVAELYKKIKSCDFVLIIEKDMHIFKAALTTIDLSTILSQPNIAFCVEEDMMTVFKFLQGMSIPIVANGLTVLRHDASCKLYNDFYKQAVSTLKDVTVWAKVNISAQVKTTNTYYKNIFTNTPTMLKTPGVDTLFQKFNNTPAIVVAAGPSLNKNIALLKTIEDSFLIIAVDTALKILLKHNIKPHLIVSIDYTPDNLRYFKDLDTTDSCLIVDPEVYPEIFENFSGKKLIMNIKDKSLCEWLKENGIIKGDMEKGLSVAHTAFLTAKELGCNPIIFIGQDLAYTGGSSHAKGAVMSTKIDINKVAEGTATVTDIFGKEVTTSTSMLVFLKHFEEILFNVPIKCIDATEGGAKIKGTEIMSLREAIALFKNEGSIRKKLNSLLPETIHPDYETFIKNIQKTVDNLEQLHTNCTTGITIISKIRTLLDQSKLDVLTLKSLCKQWKDQSKKIYEKKEIMTILRDNITDALVLQAKKQYNISELDNLSDEKSKKSILTSLDRDKLFYEWVKDSCLFVQNQFKILKQQILKQ